MSGLTRRRHAPLPDEVEWSRPRNLEVAATPCCEVIVLKQPEFLLTARSRMGRREALGIRGSASATGAAARPKVAVAPVSSRPFCIAVGSMEPSSTGRRDWLALAEGEYRILGEGE